MGALRTIAAVSATAGSRTPVYTGAVTAAVSFSIKRGIATITLGSLPDNGYNGPNGFIPVPTFSAATASQSDNRKTGSPFDIHGGVAPGPVGKGQQVTLWGFATATYFNGVTVTVIDNNPATKSFRFYFNHADVNTTADAGNTAVAPTQHYRAVRLEADAGNTTHIIYVGDLNVSSSQYTTALTLTGQISFEIAGDNIPADRIFIDTDNTGSKVQVTLIY